MPTQLQPATPETIDPKPATADRQPRTRVRPARPAAPAVDRPLLILALLVAGCLLASCTAPAAENAQPEANAPAESGVLVAEDDAVDTENAAPASSDSADESASAGSASEPGGQAPPASADADPAVDPVAPSSAVTTTEGSAPDDAPGSAPADGAVAPVAPAAAVPASTAAVGQVDTNGQPAAPADALAPDPSIAPAASGGQPAVMDADPRTHLLSIERLRTLSYPGSDLVVVETLAAGSNYSRSVVSYESEGNTIYALFTVPNGERPATGWPVVVFNHGYIPPAQYRTTERYVAYQDAFARNGYIVFKSDYRGHGSSEGEATGGRGTPDYTIDVLNGMASVARHPDADPNRIGMWGHSMGGSITLRSMVLSKQIKAGVIWAGVVASYTDMYNRLGQGPATASSGTPRSGRRSWRLDLVERFGTPEENPTAWNAVSPNAYLADISGPLQLHHGTADTSVPVEYSAVLQQQMEAAGRPSEYFVYQGDDHNLSQTLSLALQRSVAFFDQHVKGGG